jgi:hypothetical protein
VRNQIKSTSDLSDIRMQEEIQFAKVASRRKLEQENLESEKQRVNIAEETFQLQKRLEKSEIEEDTPVQMLKMERKLELLQKELELRKLEYETRELAVRTDILTEKAKQELRKEILPLEQVPEIAGAVSQLFRGANLSVYGETAQPLFSTIGPLVDLLTNSLRHAGVSVNQPETGGQSQTG